MFTRPATRLVLVAAVFLLLGTVCTSPLARHFSQGVPYTAYGQDDGLPRHNVHGDHLQLYYRFWLFGEAASGRAEPFQDPYEFSLSDGDTRRVAVYFFPYPLVFHLFSPLGRAAGYNAAIFLSYLLSGLFMFLLVRYYTGDTAASLLGGTLFAASHYRTLAVLSGHPVGLSAFLLPLFILCIEKVMKEKSLPWSFAGGLTFALLTDNDLHVLYLTALVSPAIVVKNLLGTEWRRIPHYVMGVLPAAFPFLIIALGVLALRFPLFSMIHSEGQSITRPLSEIYRYSPGLGETLVRHNPLLTKNIYLGPALVFPVLLILAGFFRFPRGDRERRAFGLVLLYGGLFFLSYMLAFGPRFPVAKPYTVLYHHLPKFSLIRQTSKFMLIATFALAAVTGLGFASLRRVLPAAKGAVILAGASLLVLVDLLPFPGSGTGISLLPARVEAYDQTFGDGRKVRSVHVPIWPGESAWSSHYLYYGTIYPSAMINGYNPLPPERYFEDVFLPLKSLNAGQIGERQLEALRSFNVEYLVLHEESFPPKVSLFPSQMTLENLKGSPFLEMISSVPPVSIFRILDEERTGAAAAHVPSQAGVVHHERSLRGGEAVSDADASDGGSLRIGGEAGTTVTVPRRTTPAGRFTLAARVRSEEPAGFLLRTRSSKDNSVVAWEDFTMDPAAGYGTFAMDFALDESRSVYHEFVKEDDSTLFLDWISMRFAAAEAPPSFIEVEELFHIGNAAEHTGASGGRALRLTSADPPGKATRGPYRLFGTGEYEVLLSAALDREVRYEEEAPVFALAVRNHLDEFPRDADAKENRVMAEQSITASEVANVAGDNSFGDFTFRFSLKRPTFLSFNVRHFARTIYLDTITIRKVKK